MTNVIQPTIDDVLRGGRFDVISVGFVLALWSGSRAMHVFVDTITIMHGLSGHRGIVKTRALSFSLYLLAIVTGVVALPLVVAGPRLVHRWLPDRADFLVGFYWPVVLVLCICFLATLYHVSIPVRTKWRINLPGATFALGVWVLGSFVLRGFLTVTAADSRSIYGPLAAPIAILLWLYILSIAVLVGAALNAAFDTVFPQQQTAKARSELVAAAAAAACTGRRAGRPGAVGSPRARPIPSRPAPGTSSCPSTTARPGGCSAAGSCSGWRSSRSPCCWCGSTAGATATTTTRRCTTSTWSTRSTTRPSRSALRDTATSRRSPRALG